MYLQSVLPDHGDLLDMILDLARAFYYSIQRVNALTESSRCRT